MRKRDSYFQYRALLQEEADRLSLVAIIIHGTDVKGDVGWLMVEIDEFGLFVYHIGETYPEAVANIRAWKERADK